MAKRTKPDFFEQDSIEVSLQKDIVSACSCAIANKLFVNRKEWSLATILSIELSRAKRKTDGTKPSWAYLPPIVSMAYAGEVPVGIGIVSDGQISVYIKPKYRKKGIGTRLVTACKNSPEFELKKVYSCAGIKGSEKFWESNKIVCY